MPTSGLFGLGYIGAIVVLSIWASLSGGKIPERIEVCMVWDSGQENRVIWSDHWERYEYHYPKSYQGRCR